VAVKIFVVAARPTTIFFIRQLVAELDGIIVFHIYMTPLGSSFALWIVGFRKYKEEFARDFGVALS
jgi:hypothetical protein